MRIHRLEFQAIGPFPGHHEISFDELGSNNLFLLEGETGSGKTTIIDAIVYALYGKVSLDSQASIDRLRCDYSDEKTKSFVELDFSTSAGIYRVRRTPVQFDISKRDHKTLVKRNATAALWKLEEVAEKNPETPLETKSREVGIEMKRILQLDSDQFLQTVVLPQGNFSRFLTSKSDDREAILQDIFGTKIYKDIQLCLAERASEVRQIQKEAKHSLDLSLEDFREKLLDIAATFKLDEEPLRKINEVFAQLGDNPDEKLLEGVTRLVIDQLDRRLDSARKKLSAAEDEQEKHQIKLNQATELIKAQEEYRSVAQVFGKLEQQKEDITQRREALEQAQSANPVIDAHGHVKKAADKVEDSYRKLIAHYDNCVRHDSAFKTRYALVRPPQDNVEVGVTMKFPQEISEDELWTPDESAIEILLSDADELQEQRGRLKAALKQEKQLEELTLAQTRDESALEEVQTALNKLFTSLDEVKKDTEDNDTQLKHIQEKLEELRSVRRVDSELESTVSAAVEAQKLDKQLVKLNSELASLDTELKEAQNHHSEVEKRWKNNTAVALAEYLDNDTPCPVCGSVEHPNIAHTKEDEVSLSDLSLAKAAVHSIQTRIDVLSKQKQDVSKQRENYVAKLDGHRIEEVVEKSQERKKQLKQLDDIEKQFSATTTKKDSLDKIHKDLTQKQSELQKDIASISERIAGFTDQITQLTKELLQAKGNYDSVAAHQEALEAQRLRLVDAVKMAQEVTAAKDSLSQRLDDQAAQVEKSIFDRVATALKAAMTKSDLTNEAKAIKAYDEAVLQVRTQMKQQRLLEAKDQPTPDITALNEEVDKAKEITGAARDTITQLHGDGQRIQAEHNRVTKRINRYENSFKEHADLLRLYQLASAKDANVLHTPLATWVLLSRLDDVLQRANPMIQAISDGAYELVRSDSDGSRADNQGLSMSIMDYRTGKKRKISTISGGETFYCSLALALALSQVVSAEAGGISLETMFIDEGFGTLDREKLEKVIKQLAGSDYRGRSIGIISHVEEIRNQIQSRVSVMANPKGKGSTLKVIT